MDFFLHLGLPILFCTLDDQSMSLRGRVGQRGHERTVAMADLLAHRLHKRPGDGAFVQGSDPAQHFLVQLELLAALLSSRHGHCWLQRS